MESINPVDNPVGMPRNNTKDQDSQAERRENSKHRVVLARSLSNSTSSPLSRAIMAYRRLSLSGTPCRRPSLVPKRAKWLNAAEMARLVEHYEAGATVYELAAEFGIHRTIISQRLKGAGVEMRFTPLTKEQTEAAVALYETGLSLADVGWQLGFNSSTIHRALRQRGVNMRKPWDHPLQAGDANTRHISPRT